MPLWYLTKEKKDELCKLRNEKVSCWWMVHVAQLCSNRESKKLNCVLNENAVYAHKLTLNFLTI